VRTLATAIVDWNAIGKVVTWSFAAGVGITLCYSLSILGAVRFTALKRNHRSGVAIFYAALSLAGLAATVGAVVLGIVVMTNKS
jgi:hypothetical protein